jgi:hypothetical protein
MAMLGGLLLAWLVADTPLEPGRAQGWLRADALSALLVLVLAGHLLVAHSWQAEPWRAFAALGLLSGAALTGHLALIAVLLVLGAAARSTPHRAMPLLAMLATAGGLLLIGVVGGEWRYDAPAAGSGLNSLSFGLLLLGALLSSGGIAIVRGRVPTSDPLVAAACLFALLRLYSFGPWNLGWLFAALLVGTSMALAAAWHGAAAPGEQGAAWQGAYLSGLTIVGAGLGSGAGVVLAGYALLLGPVLRLGLTPVPAGPTPLYPHGEKPTWPRWLLSGATPLTGPFVLAWLAIAAALAGGLSLLAVVLWVAALLAALAVVRQDERQALSADEAPAPGRRDDSEDAGAPLAGRPEISAEEALAPGTSGEAEHPSAQRRVYVAAALSAGLGLGAPLVLWGLLNPVAAQLQGGLTPFGTLELWPWAGLLALNAARQPVATLPSLALAALMLILAALGWLGWRLRGMRDE